MRLLADENVSRQVIEALRACGFDVVSVASANAGASDRDVLTTAGEDGRILITETATSVRW